MAARQDAPIANAAVRWWPHAWVFHRDAHRGRGRGYCASVACDHIDTPSLTRRRAADGIDREPGGTGAAASPRSPDDRRRRPSRGLGSWQRHGEGGPLSRLAVASPVGRGRCSAPPTFLRPPARRAAGELRSSRLDEPRGLQGASSSSTAGPVMTPRPSPSTAWTMLTRICLEDEDTARSRVPRQEGHDRLGPEWAWRWSNRSFRFGPRPTRWSTNSTGFGDQIDPDRRRTRHQRHTWLKLPVVQQTSGARRHDCVSLLLGGDPVGVEGDLPRMGRRTHPSTAMGLVIGRALLPVGSGERSRRSIPLWPCTPRIGMNNGYPAGDRRRGFDTSIPGPPGGVSLSHTGLQVVSLDAGESRAVGAGGWVSSCRWRSATVLGRRQLQISGAAGRVRLRLDVLYVPRDTLT